MKKFAIMAFVFIAPFLFAITAKAYYDNLTTNVPLISVTIGQWEDRFSDAFQNDLKSRFMLFLGVETEEELYNDPQFQTIMEGTTAKNTGNIGDEVEYQFNNINLFGTNWDFNGLYSRSGANTSVGFLRIIDRYTENGVPKYRVSPDVVENFQGGENFFVAYDIKNNITENNNSFRIENNGVLTTTNRIFDFEKIDFYGIIGLEEAGDRIANQNRNLTIYLSTDGLNYTVLQIVSVPPSNQRLYNNVPVSEDFMHFSINLSQEQIQTALNDGYYIRLEFDGSWQGGGNNARRSRLILDDFKIE